ncbi:hypothetical protein F6U93_06805 [Tamlana haliotis]|uniref:Uncharacterized protein n=1 Tax=Pseudotamlana haliotis TaxID=2614804 RepID=A0A6N6MF83_9FLAO|nr:hypothetical protein [Tamlana haliotis]KAB1068404.1 hypothetical protein F6U93_06805 [Tamlana haliotis]
MQEKVKEIFDIQPFAYVTSLSVALYFVDISYLFSGTFLGCCFYILGMARTTSPRYRVKPYNSIQELESHLY